jgi:hypothetical protein
MTWLVWARFLLLASLVALVALYIEAEFRRRD